MVSRNSVVIFDQIAALFDKYSQFLHAVTD